MSKLDDAIEYAERLREAGVLHIKVAGLEMTLAPPSDSHELPSTDPELEDLIDNPLSDPDSYGSKDGHVPGFQRLREKKEEG